MSAPFDLPLLAPERFRYQSDLISQKDERELLTRLAGLAFEPFQFRGYEGRRRVISFGLKYDFNGPGLVGADPLPDWLLRLRDRAAAFAELSGSDFAHVLINEYREGAPSAGIATGRSSTRWWASRCWLPRSCASAAAQECGSSGSTSRWSRAQPIFWMVRRAGSGSTAFRRRRPTGTPSPSATCAARCGAC